MPAEYTNPNEQTIAPGESAIFTLATIPCTRGFVRWRSGSGAFNLAGLNTSNTGCRCGCTNNRAAYYDVNFGANVAIPEDGTVAPISFSLSLDGVTLPETTRIVTPSAVNEFNNLEWKSTIPIWNNCCQTLSVTNTGTAPVTMTNPLLSFNRFIIG